MADFISFGYAIVSGLIGGAIYDFYRVLRYYSKPKKVLSYIEDLLFWIILGFVFFIVFIKLTGGILRGYVFVGVLLGGLIYFLLLSKYIYYLIIHIFKLILGLVSEIIKVISFPFRKVFSFFRTKIKRLYLLPKIVFKDMERYRKIISRKK